jgi:hypothetical protein
MSEDIKNSIAVIIIGIALFVAIWFVTEWSWGGT